MRVWMCVKWISGLTLVRRHSLLYTETSPTFKLMRRPMNVCLPTWCYVTEFNIFL